MEAPNPVAFTIFGIDVMWYGVLIASAMGLAVLITCRRGLLHGVDPDRVLNFCIISIPIGVIGARLYYVIFEWGLSAGFAKILQIRNGGLAIHGGLIFAFITVVILCRVWNEKPLNILDMAIPAVALAQSIGRWGNFFNSEAHGGPTNLPWAITVDGIKVHPTFLYESIWCFLLFFFLLYVDNRRKFTGQTFLLYCMLYSAERFLVEGLRTDSLMLVGIIKQAQLLSIIVIVVSLISYIYLNKKSALPGFLSPGGKITSAYRKQNANEEK